MSAARRTAAEAASGASLPWRLAMAAARTAPEPARSPADLRLADPFERLAAALGGQGREAPQAMIAAEPDKP
ncbi:hypothetical protein LO763_27135 [Glycomyces sp. A-F 0318]|uniref:hypothetical protein n=1 Tax=Glycomyces amatae TaxID=2881355 RepID=UPI001E50B7EE|nr:hypothetical protein [Glycomyces amatae]MCD0447295.1 hypothetical protein [Glycomyces amatae]